MKKKLLLTAMCFLTANNYMAETKKDIRLILHSPETIKNIEERSAQINEYLATKKQYTRVQPSPRKAVSCPQLPAYSATSKVQQNFQEITAARAAAIDGHKKKPKVTFKQKGSITDFSLAGKW